MGLGEETQRTRNVNIADFEKAHLDNHRHPVIGRNPATKKVLKRLYGASQYKVLSHGLICHYLAIILTRTLSAPRGESYWVVSCANRKLTMPINAMFCSICHHLAEIPMSTEAAQVERLILLG